MEQLVIKKILLTGECVTLECKRAKSEVPKSVWETYSAFANTIGGVILLGIEENHKETDTKKRFQIVGVDDAQKIVNDFWNTINSDKANENILTSEDVDIAKIIEGGNSKARNPRIQNMLRMVGYGENLGSGFPIIISAWKDAKWGEPELKNKFEIDEVELVLPIPVRGANDRVNDKINDRINDRIMATYTIIRLNPGIKRKDISNISGKSLPTIDRHIDVLTEDGLIEYRGSRKTGGYYVK